MAGSSLPPPSPDLRERPEAKPGPPRREPAEAIDGPSRPLRPYDRANDRPMVRNELRIAVRSGSLTVGLLSRSTNGPETWSWVLTGVRRPDDDFAWRGNAETDWERVRRDRDVVVALDLLGRTRTGRAAPARRRCRCITMAVVAGRRPSMTRCRR